MPLNHIVGKDYIDFVSDSRRLEVCGHGCWSRSIMDIFPRHHNRNNWNSHGRASYFWIRRSGQNYRHLPWEIINKVIEDCQNVWNLSTEESNFDDSYCVINENFGNILKEILHSCTFIYEGYNIRIQQFSKKASKVNMSFRFVNFFLKIFYTISIFEF